MVNKKSKTSINEIFKALLLVFLVLFSLIVIYQLLLKILGGSWTFEDIIMSLGVIIITTLFMIAGFLISLSRTVGRLEERFTNLKGSFFHLADDFKDLKDNLKEHTSQKRH